MLIDAPHFRCVFCYFIMDLICCIQWDVVNGGIAIVVVLVFQMVLTLVNCHMTTLLFISFSFL